MSLELLNTFISKLYYNHVYATYIVFYQVNLASLKASQLQLLGVYYYLLQAVLVIATLLETFKVYYLIPALQLYLHYRVIASIIRCKSLVSTLTNILRLSRLSTLGSQVINLNLSITTLVSIRAQDYPLKALLSLSMPTTRLRQICQAIQSNPIYKSSPIYLVASPSNTYIQSIIKSLLLYLIYISSPYNVISLRH